MVSAATLFYAGVLTLFVLLAVVAAWLGWGD